MYFTCHDLKVNTDQIAYPTCSRGSISNVEILPHLNTYRYFKGKNGQMAYLFFQRRRMVKGEKEGCQFSTLKFDNIYKDLLVI